jgi:hypothetical protein
MKDGEEDVFDLLEAGKSVKARGEDGKVVALCYFTPRRKPDYWRTAWFESNWIADRKCHFDSRKRNQSDFFLPFERYAEAAAAAKEEIEAGRRPMLPSQDVPAMPAPAAAAPRPEEPEKPMMAHELQQILREEREADIWNQRLLRERDRDR